MLTVFYVFYISTCQQLSSITLFVTNIDWLILVSLLVRKGLIERALDFSIILDDVVRFKPFNKILNLLQLIISDLGNNRIGVFSTI